MNVEKKVLETKVKGVIVYQTGCQLTHKGAINLTKGEHLLTIANLPYSLDK